ncbi:RNA polymerase sigma factor [Piscinibacter sakaiensis]|nr:RNA polymerase sigma factor [Piscinibacter sakaiensis]
MLMPTDWKGIVRRVRRLLARKGMPAQEAEDVVQEAWLRLHRYQQQHEVKEPEAFLATAARRLAIDQHRRGQVRGEHLVLDEETLVDPTADVEAIVLRREFGGLMQRGLATLDEQTRRIFIANLYEGESYGDLAIRYRISVAAVERSIARATLALTAASREPPE